MIDIKNVSFSRGRRQIYKKLNIQVKPGTITAILGPSGTGKTTMLRLIGGLIRPTSGQISVFSKDVGSLRRKDMFSLRRRMGMLFQNSALFTHLSAADNVAYALREHTDLPKQMIRDIVLMKLEAVGLRGAADLMPAELSGGMARRVALARALAMDPELMMYDEPLTGQDPISLAVVLKLIKTLNDSLGLTSLIVTHNVRHVFAVADYAYIVSDGVVVGHGTPKKLLTKSQDPRVQQFVHGEPDGPVNFHYPAPKLKNEFEY